MAQQKIAIGDGKFCYSGPNCRLHGSAQILNAKRQLFEAQQRLSYILQFDDDNAQRLELAQQEVATAQRLYDATSEGQAWLREVIASFDKETTSVPLWHARRDFQYRLQAAESYAARYERENSSVSHEEEITPVNKSSLGQLLFNQEHSYGNIAEPTVEEDGTGLIIRTGSKYNASLSFEEMANSIQQDIAEAASKNYLPADLDYDISTVPSEDQITVKVSGLDKYGFETPILDSEHEDLRELGARLGKIIRAYRYSQEENEWFESNLYFWVNW